MMGDVIYPLSAMLIALVSMSFGNESCYLTLFFLEIYFSNPRIVLWAGAWGTARVSSHLVVATTIGITWHFPGVFMEV